MGTRRFWANKNAFYLRDTYRSSGKMVHEQIREINQDDFELYEPVKEINRDFKSREKNFRSVAVLMNFAKRGLWFKDRLIPAFKSFLRYARNGLSKILTQTNAYLKKLAKKLFLFSINTLFYFHKKRLSIPEEPRRILICNLANFGDVVISTTVLPLLKNRYPTCEIGFLTSLKAAGVFKNHPLVTYFHTMDHWYGNLSLGFCKAVFRHFIDFIRAARDIKRYRYDLAIDLYPQFIQSAIPLVFAAKIPVRIARVSQGYKSLTTYEISPIDSSVYMGRNHLNLLKELKLDAANESPFPSYFCPRPNLQSLPKEYVVVHMGTAVAYKKWDTKKWVQVVSGLMERGETVLLTGSGDNEAAECAAVSIETGCLNFCNQLSWIDFCGVIQNAKLLISVDSASIHVGAAKKVPSIIIFSGVSPIALWKPPYSLSIAVTKSVSCAPCLLINGCRRMSCIQEVEAEDVLMLLKNRLSRHTATV